MQQKSVRHRPACQTFHDSHAAAARTPIHPVFVWLPPCLARHSAPSPAESLRRITWDRFEDEEGINGACNWLCRYRKAFLTSGASDAIVSAVPAPPGTKTIRHLNRPQELLRLFAEHNLSLQKLLDDIICGEYALYRIDYQNQFAVAGIRRGDNGGWLLDDIRGARNANAPEEVGKHFLEWLALETTHKSPVQKAVTP